LDTLSKQYLILGIKIAVNSKIILPSDRRSIHGIHHSTKGVNQNTILEGDRK
jgi:hypothetical protein